MITIVLCTYNRADMLHSALTSLERQEGDIRTEFEILVVDDGSTDATPDIVEAHRRLNPSLIRYVQQDNHGIGSARNLGVAEARGEWIAFFDDDQIADPSWLAALYNTAVATEADCVGGVCRLSIPFDHELAKDSTIRRLLGENLQIIAPRRGLLSLIDPRTREALPGTGNVIAKSTLFRSVGKFSDRAYGEDLEFFRRGQTLGAKIGVTRAAIVQHIIPIQRLQARYLLELAAAGGRSQAEIDLATGQRSVVFLLAALRSLHFLTITVPAFMSSLVFGNRAQAIARKCSMRFARAYVGAAFGKSAKTNSPSTWCLNDQLSETSRDV